MNPTNRRKSFTSASSATATATSKMDATRKRIHEMEAKREERRKSMLERKAERQKTHEMNVAKGNPGDVDFIGMVEEWRRQQKKNHQAPITSPSASNNICIAIRKRPINDKERAKLDHDSVSVIGTQVTVHSAKFRVDGITKYLTHNSFQFDHAFDEDSTTEQIYVQTTLPLVDHVVATRGRATVFCYGQTGSGKTFTMSGIQQILAYDLYEQILESAQDLDVRVAFFELYGGFIQDLLHDRKRCKLLEDGKGEVNITGLQEVAAPSPEDFLRIIDEGHSMRTTHMTEANDTSSRSHAICQVFLRQDGKLKGKLSLVDLAGSERGSDTKSHNHQRRSESAEINTSLLSLKECIRALGQKSAHVPYRGSKLTLILKDCFSPDSKTTMIATASPGASSTDHSLNTLRYADRIKEQRTTAAKSGAKGGSIKSPRAQPPSQKRLELIANANQIALDRCKSCVDDLLASEHRTLSPKGLVETSNYLVAVEEDQSSVDLLMSESGGVTSHEVIEEETHADEEEEDEDYAPSEEDSEDEYYDAADDVEEENLDQLANSMDDEEEMRRIVQILFEMEESLLNQHMSNIQEHAEMLTQEGKLLQGVQPGSVSEEEMDEYAIQLAEYLDRKEILIYKLQQKLDEFKGQLAKEQEMAQRVQQLSQY